MISYAQNFEDVLLARAFAGRGRGFYVDVGAWLPATDSVTKHFYDLGWSGINIEPVEEYFKLLQRERPRDVNLQLAVGERKETRRFYRFAGSGLSTFCQEPVAGYSALGLQAEEVDVEVLTLREICETYVRGEIDFLKIDVEGWEKQVILGGDWERYRPRIVLVEAVAPNPEAFLSADPNGHFVPEPAWESWEGFLCGQGYELCYYDGLNRFYVRQEDRGLHAAFRFPPNVYDRFESLQTVELRARLEEVTEAVERLEKERLRLTGDVERYRSHCGELERRQEDLSGRAAAAESESRRLAQELGAAVEDRDALARDLAAVRQERDELRDQERLLAARLRAVLSSRSWRSTSLLRWLARRLRAR
jgi:FkbM family methyltransferase